MKLFIVTRDTGVFLDQPRDVTITESENATFKCAVVNSSFSIFWLVNDTDAEYEIFRRRGITVMPVTDTISHLIVEGYKKYNNTLVHCAAIHYHNYTVIAWISSQKALLKILGKCTSQINDMKSCLLNNRHVYALDRSVFIITCTIDIPDTILDVPASYSSLL